MVGFAMELNEVIKAVSCSTCYAVTLTHSAVSKAWRGAERAK